ncbi:MAG: tyrosine-type recombinase/integrase, partial [Janthinobacterium lividum]
MSSPALPLPASPILPALFHAVPEGGRRFWEFFTVNIRNPNTRRAYFKAVETFAAWCAERSLEDL